MADKISMLLMMVDLDCHKCYDKMRKILCKLQDQERIRTISFDDKSKTIAIAGPFDPQRLACKIRCRGGKTVKDVQIVDVGGPSSPVNNGKRKQKEKHPACQQPMKPRPPTPPPPCPKPPEQYPPVECVIPTVETPSWPAALAGPCRCPCCAPCYQGFYEGCRCGCGGRVYGCATPPAWCGYRGCRIIIEEEPNAACSIM